MSGAIVFQKPGPPPRVVQLRTLLTREPQEQHAGYMLTKVVKKSAPLRADLSIDVEIPDPSKPTMITLLIQADEPGMCEGGHFPFVSVVVEHVEKESAEESPEGQ